MPAFVAQVNRGYTDDMVRGGMHADEAHETAERDSERLLPGAVPAPGHHIFVLEDAASGERRGVLWFAEQQRGDRKAAHVYAVEIDEPYRGRGLGREAMLLFERLAVELGAEDADLAVFGGNAAALSLYESLGYRVTVRLMRKALRPPSEP